MAQPNWTIIDQVPGTHDLRGPGNMPNNANNRYNEWIEMFKLNGNGNLNPTYHVPAQGYNPQEYTNRPGLHYVRLS